MYQQAISAESSVFSEMQMIFDDLYFEYEA